MMVSSNGKSGRRRMNFDLNLVPFIDVLSTCICFLLLTAVFMQLGTVNVRQAMGDGAASSAKEQPTMWLRLASDGGIHVSVKNVKSSRASEFLVRGNRQTPDFDRLDRSLKVVKQTYPTLATALILPAAESRYADLIQLMDTVKRGQFAQVGIAPL